MSLPDPDPRLETDLLLVFVCQSSASSDEDERFILTNTRPMTPLVLNPVHVTSCWDVLDPAYEPTPQLPTPEERMRRQAEAVAADIVPINVTGRADPDPGPGLLGSGFISFFCVPPLGESFDRQASFRRALSSSDSLTRRPRTLSRRRTVTGIPDDAGARPPVSEVLPGQFSTVGRPASNSSSSSSCTSPRQDKTPENTEERGDIRKEGRPSGRRIRAPRGEGISSLMASLTSSPLDDQCTSSDVRSLPRLDTNSSLSSEGSCQTLSAASSWYQVGPESGTQTNT